MMEGRKREEWKCAPVSRELTGVQDGLQCHQLR